MLSKQRWQDAMLLLAGVLVGLAFLNAQGTEDRGRWLVFMHLSDTHGIFGTYTFAALSETVYAHTSYPPLGLIILACLAQIADFLKLTYFTALKLSIIPFTLGCACIIAIWREGPLGRLYGASMFLLLTLNALLLAYIDVYFLIFLLAAFYYLDRGHFGTGSLMFVLSCLVKWQPIILIPFVILYVWPRCTARDFRRFIPAIAILLMSLAVYGSPMANALANGLQEPTLSGRALNLNWLITARAEAHWPHYVAKYGAQVMTMNTDQLDRSFSAESVHKYRVLLSLSSALRYFCYLVALGYFFLSKRTSWDLLRASVLAFLAYCVFGMAVHENHWLVPAALALCWFAIDRTRWFEAVVIALIFNLNLLIYYGINGDGPGFSTVIFGQDVTIWLAAFNVLFFVGLWTPMALQALRLVRVRDGHAA